MTFTSDFFLLGCLPVFLIVFYSFRKSDVVKRAMIIIANVVFYIWGGAQVFLLVLAICLLTYIGCRLCEKVKKKWLLFLICFIVIIPLVEAKYLGIFSDEKEILPLGISFYTFTALSCIIDVYRGGVQVPTLAETFMYICFFPCVSSGPIVRFNNFKEGLNQTIELERLNDGIELLVVGLCKKVLVADKLSALVAYYFDGVAMGNKYSTLGLWIGSIAYTLQIYFDFAGYSEMAIGISKMLGFDIPANFNRPYQANSIQDFWRRWHISLSTWFRDYIYIPLGGNRCSAGRQVVNMLVVWSVTGIWHGADWSFLVWGLGYFVLLACEKYINPLKELGKKWHGHIYTLFFVNLLWVPFRAADMDVTIQYLKGMFSVTSKSIEEKAIDYLPLLTVGIVLCFPWNKILGKFFETKVFEILKCVVLVIMLFIAICVVVNATYTPYIYGNF